MAERIVIYAAEPSLTSPSDYAVLDPQDTYTGAAGNSGGDGASAYRFQATDSTDTGFAAPFDDVSDLETPSYTPSEAYSDGDILWRFGAVVGALTNWTEARHGSVNGSVVNIVPPAILSNAVVGTEMTGDDGIWQGTPTLSYQWQKNIAGTPTAIDGATAIDYTPVAGDFGYPLRLAVHDSVDDTTAYSNWTYNCAAEPTQTPTELLTDNGFDNTGAWTKGTGWTVSGGKATKAAGSQTLLYQAVKPANEFHLFEAVVTCDSMAASGYQVRFGNSGETTLTQAGTHRHLDFLNDASTTLGLLGTSTLEGQFDNFYGRSLAYTSYTAPSAAMRLTAYFTLPGTPAIGTSVRVAGRVNDLAALEWWYAELKYDGADWNLYLQLQQGGAVSSVDSALDIGAANGIRLVFLAGEITVETSANVGETWTERCTYTSSIYVTATTCGVFVTSDVSDVVLRYELASAPTEYFAAAAADGGSASNDGTELSPFLFPDILLSSSLQPGNTLTLLAGTMIHTSSTHYNYTGGSAAQPVIIRNKPGDVVRLRNFGLIQTVHNVIWQSADYGLIIDSDITDRTSVVPSLPGHYSGFRFPETTDVGVNELRNIRIENVPGTAINMFGRSHQNLYGCIVRDNGWDGSDRPHGPGLYSHCGDASLHKTITLCIGINNADRNFGVGDGGLSDPALGYRFDRCVSLGGGMLQTSTYGDDNEWDQCWIFAGNLFLGYYVLGTPQNGSSVFANGVIDPLGMGYPKCFDVINHDYFEFQGNIVTDTANNLTLNDGGSSSVQALAADSSSAASFVHLNEYAAGYAFLFHYDFNKDRDAVTNEIVVDVSDLIAGSGTVRVINPQDFTEYEDIAVTDGSFTLETAGWTNPLPNGFATRPWGMDDALSARQGAWILKDVTA